MEIARRVCADRLAELLCAPLEPTADGCDQRVNRNEFETERQPATVGACDQER
jgi:hypothetical protein